MLLKIILLKINPIAKGSRYKYAAYSVILMDIKKPLSFEKRFYYH